MDRILILIFIFFMFRKFFQDLKKQTQAAEKETDTDETQRFLTDLGLITPTPSLVKSPQIDEEKQPVKQQDVSIEEKIKKPEPEVAKVKPVEVKLTKEKEAFPPTEVPEETFDFSQDKVKEGIILSTVLGPPKAYQLCRGGEIGRRAGLKNQ